MFLRVLTHEATFFKIVRFEATTGEYKANENGMVCISSPGRLVSSFTAVAAAKAAAVTVLVVGLGGQVRAWLYCSLSERVRMSKQDSAVPLLRADRS